MVKFLQFRYVRFDVLVKCIYQSILSLYCIRAFYRKEAEIELSSELC